MIIRKGVKNDIPETLELVKELAKYENAFEKVSNTIDKMEEDGFGDNPIFDLFVAEENTKIVGIAITYFRFSTWKGKVLYLEDLIVKEKYRRKGIGNKIFDKVISFARENNSVGISLQVLDWNQIGINFYKKYDMEFDKEWINCYLEL